MQEAGLAQHFVAHLPQHLDIPVFGLHLTLSFMPCAATGKARVAAVRAARVASFNDVFMRFPWGWREAAEGGFAS